MYLSVFGVCYEFPHEVFNDNGLEGPGQVKGRKEMTSCSYTVLGGDDVVRSSGLHVSLEQVRI